MRKRAIRTGDDREGFTLIEVMMALAIMVLLAGALFGTVRATLSATAALSETQRYRQQIFGFFALCRKTLPGLPFQATILSKNGSQDGHIFSELNLRQAPEAFAWGDQRSFYGETSISTHAANDGSSTLGIEQREIDRQTGLTKSNPTWLPLLYNLQTVKWSFYDPRTGKWQDFWGDTSQHPTLISLSLTFHGETRIWSQTFLLPPISAPPAPSAPTSKPAPSSTEPPPPTDPATGSTTPDH